MASTSETASKKCIQELLAGRTQDGSWLLEREQERAVWNQVAIEQVTVAARHEGVVVLAPLEGVLGAAAVASVVRGVRSLWLGLFAPGFPFASLLPARV
ncbi:hypothetical protein, partial [Clavibacter michiganensis]|uniref:hypothetical protein n=1 Tax=Clavibacter michiganensis TaxID=28447 RepID=UPI002931F451